MGRASGSTRPLPPSWSCCRLIPSSPRWEVWTNFGIDRAAALATDGLRATRAIEFPVGRPEEAQDMFDVITYDKGGAVLRMIERYLGDETSAVASASTSTSTSLATPTPSTCGTRSRSASGQPVRTTMGTWVNQAGPPSGLSRANGGGRRSSSVPTPLPAGRGRRGRGGTALGSSRSPCATPPTTVRWSGSSCCSRTLDHDRPEGRPAWALVNESAWGVYRVDYSDDLRRKLSWPPLELDERERFSLASDTWARPSPACCR